LAQGGKGLGWQRFLARFKKGRGRPGGKTVRQKVDASMLGIGARRRRWLGYGKT